MLKGKQSKVTMLTITTKVTVNNVNKAKISGKKLNEKHLTLKNK